MFNAYVHIIIRKERKERRGKKKLKQKEEKEEFYEIFIFYHSGKSNPFNPDMGWCSRWLSNNSFTHRVGTKDAKKMEKNPADQENYLYRIALMIKDHNIPPELVYFWDEYGQELVPASKCTFAKKGSKDVIIHGLDDKRQITGTLCHNAKLEFVGGQLIFQVRNYKIKSNL